MARVTLVGEDELRRRLRAIADQSGNRAMMGQLAAIVVKEAQGKAPRRTGSLQGSIRVDAVSDDHAVVGAHMEYAADVEFGTKAHPIVPRRRRALRFAATSGGARLTGTPRRGAGVVFARHVQHPGTKPQPYMKPALDKAARLAPAAMSQSIVGRWNRAA